MVSLPRVGLAQTGHSTRTLQEFRGDFPGVLCRWIHFIFPSFFPRNTKPGEFVWSCWTSGEKLKSSGKAFPCVLLVAWGDNLVFFPCFPPFFHGRGGFLSPCLSHLRLAAQFELEKQKFTFHSGLG